MTRVFLIVLATLLLGGCASAPKSPTLPVPASVETRDPPGPTPPRGGARPDKPGEYTAGGLYKPGVADSGPAIPPDISHLKEPVPREEPRARYGNRSPYSVLGKSYNVMPSAKGYVERGTASWYGAKFHGRATSSLEPYDMYAFTAAHKTLPLPTYARVTNLDNGRSIIVRVNDRGPFHHGRIIDLSYAAAIKLGIHVRGTGNVEVRALTSGTAEPAAPVAVSGKYWLQVASFGARENARKLADQLQDADVDDVDIQRADVRGSKVFRVRIGPVKGRDAADRLAARVRALGLGRPEVVAE